MATEKETGWMLIIVSDAPHAGAEGVPGVDRVKLTRKEIGSPRLSTGVTSFEPGAGLYWHMLHVEESVTVVEGEMVCEVGSAQRPVESHRVGLFDTTFIPAHTPHRFYNPTTARARILWSYPDGQVERIRVNPDGNLPHAPNAPTPGGSQHHEQTSLAVMSMYRRRSNSRLAAHHRGRASLPQCRQRARSASGCC